MDCYVVHSYHIYHSYHIFHRVPKRDAEISGNVDLRIGFAQLVC